MRRKQLHSKMRVRPLVISLDRTTIAFTAQIVISCVHNRVGDRSDWAQMDEKIGPIEQRILSLATLEVRHFIGTLR